MYVNMDIFAMYIKKMTTDYFCQTLWWTWTWWICGGHDIFHCHCHFIHSTSDVWIARMFSVLVVISIVEFLFSVKFLLFVFVILLSLCLFRGFCVYASKMEPVPGPSRVKENVPLSPPKKHPRSHINVTEKVMVLNCYKHTQNTWPEDKKI